MLKKVTITNYRGESAVYNIEGVQPDDRSGLFITSIEGLGPVKANINMTDLVTEDGSLYNSARLSSRNIVIKAFFTQATSIEDSRLLSYKYFPLKKKVKFRVETENRIAETEGYVESNEPDIFSKQAGNQISIVCEKPYFIDASPNANKQILFSSTEPEFQFEVGFPIGETFEFGEIQRNTTKIIDYNGEIETGFIMKLHITGDRVVNPVIYNETDDTSFGLDTSKLANIVGYSVPEDYPIDPNASELYWPTEFIRGDVITINSQTGQKSVMLERYGTVYNILNLIDRKPKWPMLTPGRNEFAYHAGIGEEYIEFSIEYVDKFEGV